jgi:transcriptional regulator with XRE-family HTH domain
VGVASARHRLDDVDEDDASPFGEYIRRQRELHELTMRQLADLVGISNPYLSQIERGLREPSEKVLEAIADNLEMSAETLKRHRRRRTEDAGEEPAIVAAIRADKGLTARQRQALIEVYRAFVASRARDADPA